MTKKSLRTWLAICTAALTISCTPATTEQKPTIELDKNLDSLKSAVACAHPEAARIGAEILSKGGNAVDAASAIQWALAVCYPEAGNLGGGGFMVIRNQDGTSATLDFREKAPALSAADMYLDSLGQPVEDMSLTTHQSSGVPGSVRGIYEAHARYGKLPMEQLIDPAIVLARNGFALTEKQANNLNAHANEFSLRNTAPVAFVRDGRTWQPGDTLKQPELATTLERIRDNGPNEFYTGHTASLLVEEMQKGSGIISADDLKAYHTVWRDPITFEFEGYKIISMPPPSSGGVALAQITGMYTDCMHEPLSHNSADYIHAMVEIQRRVYADRAFYLGDPDFVDVPIEALTTDLYLRRRMDNFNWYASTPSAEVSHGEFAFIQESPETTHLSVVDAEGNAVSVTTTLNDNYGSKIVVRGAGFLLNNEMDDFSVKPGTPNMFGLVGGTANAIAPGKRMLSSMTPVIVEKDDKLFLVAGSPGGSTIITSVLQTIMNTAHFDMSLTDATAAPKFHSQWLPDVIFMEEGRFESATIETLEALGHNIQFVPSLGRVDAILVTPSGTLEAVGDPRGDNHAAGIR